MRTLDFYVDVDFEGAVLQKASRVSVTHLSTFLVEFFDRVENFTPRVGVAV